MQQATQDDGWMETTFRRFGVVSLQDESARSWTLILETVADPWPLMRQERADDWDSLCRIARKGSISLIMTRQGSLSLICLTWRTAINRVYRVEQTVETPEEARQLTILFVMASLGFPKPAGIVGEWTRRAA